MMALLAQIKDIPKPSNLTGFKFLGTTNIFSNENLITVVLARVLLFAIIFAGLIFFFRMIAAGYSYMTSGGDLNKLHTISKSLLNAIIGFIVVLTSYFLIQIIETLFGVRILTT